MAQSITSALTRRIQARWAAAQAAMLGNTHALRIDRPCDACAGTGNRTPFTTGGCPKCGGTGRMPAETRR